MLEQESERTSLPTDAGGRDALDDLLRGLRLRA